MSVLTGPWICFFRHIRVTDFNSSRLLVKCCSDDLSALPLCGSFTANIHRCEISLPTKGALRSLRIDRWFQLLVSIWFSTGTDLCNTFFRPPQCVYVRKRWSQPDLHLSWTYRARQKQVLVGHHVEFRWAPRAGPLKVLVPTCVVFQKKKISFSSSSKSPSMTSTTDSRKLGWIFDVEVASASHCRWPTCNKHWV